MEKKLRETLERALDKLIQENLENTHYRLLKRKFLRSVKSKGDFLLGVIVGDMFEGLGFCTYGAYKRHPKDDEFNELLKIIQGRGDKIRERIRSLLTE